MAVTGPAPKEGPKLGRYQSAVEWVEVEDTPFEAGRQHELPPGREWHELTLRWWDVVRTMPHARLWREADWLFATDTAFLKDDFYLGALRAHETAEMRRREDQLGTTVEARRKLRIRYVAPRMVPDQPATSGKAKVTSIAARRTRLLREG